MLHLLTYIIYCFNICSRLYQQLDNVHKTPICCNVQWCPSSLMIQVTDMSDEFHSVIGGSGSQNAHTKRPEKQSVSTCAVSSYAATYHCPEVHVSTQFNQSCSSFLEVFLSAEVKGGKHVLWQSNAGIKTCTSPQATIGFRRHCVLGIIDSYHGLSKANMKHIHSGYKKQYTSS